MGVGGGWVFGVENTSGFILRESPAAGEAVAPVVNKETVKRIQGLKGRVEAATRFPA